ncbi:MAG: LmbE family protein [Bacteroidetes bacterium HGW-Bacteroidetes-21]|jgi:LmbE family N-acetylglucosaminyl deacetylase|nr:MAG: LmbE family protein [Bacteroidetes bacterium HGW-Bacteroidetes-21]
MTNHKNILILAPHTDDGELGCGGAISRFISEDKNVFYASFSLCRQSLQPGLNPDTLENELRAATRILGISPINLRLFDFEVRRFKQYRQEILETLILIRNEIQPDLVLLPSPTDTHQDHQVISEEGLRAFKNSSVLGYEMPWNNFSFNTRCFITLKQEQLQKKIDALKEYKSQEYRAYLNADFLKGLAITRGVQINAEFAEAFEVIRWIY